MSGRGEGGIQQRQVGALHQEDEKESSEGDEEQVVFELCQVWYFDGRQNGGGEGKNSE